jgi:poly(A) polymerase
MMEEDGVLTAILPEAARIDRLERMMPLAAADDVILRLAALIETDRGGATALAERLRLSRADAKRLTDLAFPSPVDPAGDAKVQRLSLYRCGPERYGDLALMLAADGKLKETALRKLIELADTWEIPVFSLGGDDVAALGVAPGPQVGWLLTAVRRWWEDGDFTADRAACLARLKEIAAQP